MLLKALSKSTLLMNVFDILCTVRLCNAGLRSGLCIPSFRDSPNDDIRYDFTGDRREHDSFTVVAVSLAPFLH